MEGGERMPYHRLRNQWIEELSQFRRTEVSLDMHSLPALTDLELSMRRVPRSKAKGPDGVPRELLHHQPSGLARLMYPQLVKMIAHGQEHIGYKGGQLQPAYKGVDQWTAATYRSLLISSHLGKFYTERSAQKQSQLYEKFMQQEQTGGRRKGPACDASIESIRKTGKKTKSIGGHHIS